MLFSRLNAARGVIKVFVIRVRRLFENLFYSFLYSYFVFVVKDDKQKIALMKVYKEKRKPEMPITYVDLYTQWTKLTCAE